MATVSKLLSYRPHFTDCELNKESYANYVKTLAELIKKEGGAKLEDEFWGAGIEIGGFFSYSTLSSWQESWGADFCYEDLTGMFGRMDDWFASNGEQIPKTNDAFIFSMMENWGFNSQFQQLPVSDDGTVNLDDPIQTKDESIYIHPAIYVMGGFIVLSFAWALLGPTIQALREEQ